MEGGQTDAGFNRNERSCNNVHVNRREETHSPSNVTVENDGLVDREDGANPGTSDPGVVTKGSVRVSKETRKIHMVISQGCQAVQNIRGHGYKAKRTRV